MKRQAFPATVIAIQGILISDPPHYLPGPGITAGECCEKCMNFNGVV